MKRKTTWYARAGGIARMGPFDTQERAAQAIMRHEKSCRCMRMYHRECDCQPYPADGAFVWPEVKP